jgi:hypothetical protein
MPARKGAVDLAATLSKSLGAAPAAPAEAPVPEAPPARAVSMPTAADAALALPAPRESRNDSPALFETERRDLAACEAAIDGLRIAFWASGKALQVIRDGRLYREGYATFEDYVEQRWQMRRAYADKLIRAWPLAERLNPIGSRELNEAQVRELLPLAVQHGDDAAAAVYETVYQAAADVDGVRVTAAVIKGAVGVLPAGGQFDISEAARQVRAYVARLASGEDQEPEAELSPADFHREQLGKARDLVRRAVGARAIRAAAKEDPGEFRKFVTEFREQLELLEQLEQEAAAQ